MTFTMPGGCLERRQILWVILLIMAMELPMRWICHHSQRVEHAMPMHPQAASSVDQSAPVLSALHDFVSLRKHYRKPKRVPIVGIFSQPYHDSDHEYDIPPNHTMIAASYVKWLEAGGATAIAIPYDASSQKIIEIVDYVDGILFPGGDSALPPAAKQVWDLLYKPSGKDGEPASFAKPLWGTCLGFEWILILASGNSSILESEFVASNVSLPLEEVQQKELFAPPMIYDIVTGLPVTMNNHHQGISPETFRATPSLVEHWEISSTNHDLSFHEESEAAVAQSSRQIKQGLGDDDHKNHGKPFVSTIEPKNPDSFPVYAVQWHPEKNAFEYATTTTTKTSMDKFPYEDIDHSAEAIAVTHQMSSFFVKVLHKHMERKHTRALRSRGGNPDDYPSIYSYPIQLGKKFEQIFIIPPSDR